MIPRTATPATIFAAACVIAISNASAQQTMRALTIADMHRFADVSNPRMSRDGRGIERVLTGRRSIVAVAAASSHVAIVQSTPTHPDVLFAVDRDSARQLSNANSWLREIQLADQEPITTRSKDGTIIHAFVMRPASHPLRRG
jgi:dipeptidyl aminopeptidase/acylaminoacyl peptidase